jgi:hypothetical protein
VSEDTHHVQRKEDLVRANQRLPRPAMLNTANKLDGQQKHDCADGCIDDRSDDTGAQAEAKPGQEPTGNEGANDAKDKITDKAQTAAIDDLTGDPAGNDADDQKYKETFIRHHLGFPAWV